MVEATRVELQDFNPLPRKEGDFDLRCNSVCRCHISIHSLVKRQTKGGDTMETKDILFQSTPS